jgi:polyhydroxyalkanoate synthase
LDKPVQDFIDTLECRYQKLLSHADFQENFNTAFNHFLHHQPKSYPGLKRQVVFQENSLTLYHYEKCRKTSSVSIPLLIVYAFINRPDILDIQEDRSFIKKLLENGLDVYLLDWGNPRPEDAQKSLKQYIDKIQQAVSRLPGRRVALLGICQGGTLSLCAAALSAKKIHALIPVVTPVDFQHSLLAGLLKNIDTLTLTRRLGNIPGALLSAGLQSLKPFRFLKMPAIDQDFFFRMERWMQECPDHPGLAFHEFIADFYQQNKLIKGQYFADKKRVDLSQLKMRILNIYAQKDHLIPVASSRALHETAGSLDYQELSFEGGHIGMFVSQKALKIIPAAIADWLRH